MSQYGGKVYVVHKCDRSRQGNRLSSVQYWGLNWGLQHERQFVFCSLRANITVESKNCNLDHYGKNIVLFNNHTETFYDTHFEWQTGAQVLHLQCSENMRLGVVKYSKVICIEKETLSALAFFSWHWHDIIKEHYFAINEKEVHFYGRIETLWSNQWLGVQLRAPRECAGHCKQPNERALSQRQIPGHTQTLFQNWSLSYAVSGMN